MVVQWVKINRTLREKSDQTGNHVNATKWENAI